MNSKALVLTTALCGFILLAAGCGKRRDPGAEIVLTRETRNLPKAPFETGSAGYTNWCLAWSKEIHVGGYEQAGTKNPKWDTAAQNALEEFACLRVTGHARDPDDWDYLNNQLRAAVNAGCNDPLIHYLYLSRISHPTSSATPQGAAEYSSVVKEMEATGYDTLLKFYASLQAAQAWRAAFAKQAPEVNQLRRQAMSHLQEVLSGREIPAHIAYQACWDLYLTISQNTKQRTDFYTQAEPILLKRWPDEGFPYVVKAEFYLDYAWEARGSGWASEITPEGKRLFADRLGIVEEAVDKAWKKDPSLTETPVLALRLELGQGKGRERMEMWYKRALVFWQNRSEAIRLKRLYLQPYWYGSEEDCLAFAREIVKSDNYYGEELLQAFFAHRELAQYYRSSRPNYWTEPQVWPDIEACFEKYFERNGDDQPWRNTYAICALRCRQWKALDEQLSKLTEVKYDYFGGQEAFQQLKQTVHERVSQAQ